MFDLSKIFDFSKKFALPDTFLKSKNYCARNSKESLNPRFIIKSSYNGVHSVVIY